MAARIHNKYVYYELLMAEVRVIALAKLYKNLTFTIENHVTNYIAFSLTLCCKSDSTKDGYVEAVQT